jgi:hypothetical protein
MKEGEQREVVNGMTKRMRMPGFTGEVSLQPTPRRYHSGRYIRQVSSSLIPQISQGFQIGRGVGRMPCDPTCVCVTGEGCPCCFDSKTLELLLPGRR